MPYPYEAAQGSKILNHRRIGSDTIDVFPTQPGRIWLQQELRGAPMTARERFAGIGALAFVLMTSPPNALRAQTPVQGVELSVRAGTVVGTVVDSDDNPVPAARLRLRDLSSGRILTTTRGNQIGEFRFSGVPASSYLVEFVDVEATVRGVSHTFVVRPAETLSTIVRLSGRRAWYTGFFKNAAMGVVSSAAGLGVTSVGTGLQPASGRF